MINTVGDLKEFLSVHNIPDDTKIWMEYTDQLATSDGRETKEFIEIKTKDGHVIDDHIVIESMSMMYDKKSNRFYILHHF